MIEVALGKRKLLNRGGLGETGSFFLGFFGPRGGKFKMVLAVVSASLTM